MYGGGHKENPPNIVFKVREAVRRLSKCNRGGELSQNTQFAYMQFSQETPSYFFKA
jgi:hypothetical protein